MIEKEIFRVLQGAFSLNAILQTVTVFTCVPAEEEKPFVVYGVEESAVDVALISLDLQSDYQGLAEVSVLQKEIRQGLEGSSHELAGFTYSFKEIGPLKFKVKRFKTGE